MALLRFLVLTIVATFCYLTIIDSAAITEEVTEKSERGGLDNNPDLNFEHVTENSVNKTENTICDKQPCAWAIYHPLTRRVNSCITNTCKCSEKTTCVQTDDDLSVGAYVYHCRPKITNDNPEIPEDN